MKLLQICVEKSSILFTNIKVNSSLGKIFSCSVYKCITREIGQDSLVRRHGDENSHVHRELENLPAYQDFVVPHPCFCITGKKTFVNLNSNNCRNKTLLKLFEGSGDHALTNQPNDLTSNDTGTKNFFRMYRYCLVTNTSQNSTDLFNLCDSMQRLTDSEIVQSLVLICLWSPNISDSQSFNSLCNSLDAEFVKRYHSWSTERQLLAADLWFHLYPSKPPSYIKTFLTTVPKVLHTLTGPQLIYTLFLINLMRNVDTRLLNHMERILESHLDSFTIGELAVIAISFFKTKTAISNAVIKMEMIEKLITAMPDVHPITSNCIIKCLRYTNHLDLLPLKHKLLHECLRHRIWKYNSQLAAHVSLLATITKVYIPELMDSIVSDMQRMGKHRLKDIEKILFALSTFPHLQLPRDDHVMKFFLRHLKGKQLINEINEYPYSYVTCLLYLAYLGTYPHEELDNVLSKQFWDILEARKNYDYARTVAMLDCLVELDEPYYTGNRMNATKRFEILESFFLHYPQKSGETTYREKLFLDVHRLLRIVVNVDVPMVHILPYMSEPVFLVVGNKDGSFEAPSRAFISDVYSGRIVEPADSRDWLIVWPPNKAYLCADVSTETGFTKLKERHFTKLGYKVVKIPLSACAKYESIRRFLISALFGGSSLTVDSLQ